MEAEKIKTEKDDSKIDEFKKRVTDYSSKIPQMQELWQKLGMPEEGKEAFDKMDQKFK